MSNARAIRVWLFWSTSWEFISLMIRRVSGGKWSHLGLGFDLDDGRQVYFEALFENGWDGPHPVSELVEFEETRRGQYERHYIPWIDAGRAHELFLRALSMVGKAGYHQWQLLAMWAFERVGRRIGLVVKDDPDRVVCSEGVARVIYPDVDLRDPERPTFDSVNPCSAYLRFKQIVKERS